MDQKQIDSIFEKGQTALERYKKNIINIEFPKIQHQIHYHHQIESYLQNFDFSHKIGDASFSIYGNYDSNTLLKKFLQKEYQILEALKTTKKECWYINHKEDSNNLLILFYGDKQSTFEKAVIQKNQYISNIPHIIEGKIVGTLSKKDITEVILKVDREFGKILLRMYERSRKTSSSE